MKNIFFFLTFCFALSTQLLAQVPPQAFNYSAVARNAAGQPIATTTIGVQISILKGSATGQVQYSENHFVNTDAFGLFNLAIGSGAVQSGSMASITWSNDNYYLKVGMDASGGTNFLTMGTTQLLSVPYAQHAKTAESLVSGGTGNFTHYIGEEFGGGVIFHLWKDTQGVEHGLIVDRVDLSTGQVWSNIDQILIGATAQSTWNGLSNSNAIVGQAGHTSSAAALCLNSSNGGFSDWYLPAIDELEKLNQNRVVINTSLSTISGAVELKRTNPANQIFYWSSTESDFFTAWYSFNGGSSDPIDKNSTYYVRAIRAF